MRIGDCFKFDGKKYVVVNITGYEANTEMHSMHREHINDYHCRRLFSNGKIGKAEISFSSYNRFHPEIIDYVDISTEYFVALDKPQKVV